MDQTLPAGSDPVSALVEHVKDCLGADGVLVAQSGALDSEVEQLIAAGWIWDGTVQYVAGKRVRVLTRG